MIKAALFDLDGVVFDTESQYSIFWGMIGREYHPEMPDFEYRIKGQTLVRIYDKYFTDEAAQRRNRLRLQPDWMSLKRPCSMSILQGSKTSSAT